MGGYILLGLLAALVVVIQGAPSIGETRRGRQAYREASQRHDALLRSKAKETDSYYCGGVFGINTNFYGDGSLKHDPATGKTYQKGQYYCRSDGLTADNLRAGSHVKRPK